ncbi:phage tail assembly chaperone [Brevundimonas sp. Root1423]|uniref:phage tail assembly chaperone n=2 Tax=unclassified Brevundimonas TaxID=2622653 RepID=UPI000AEB8A11|nr:phage tail assembly chaperone [Brevundimonas sp. Root1423]
MKTPWSGMARTAAMLGVGPEAFWRLSLKEWRMLTEAPANPAPIGRADLMRMAETWPDD